MARNLAHRKWVSTVEGGNRLRYEGATEGIAAVYVFVGDKVQTPKGPRVGRGFSKQGQGHAKKFTLS